MISGLVNDSSLPRSIRSINCFFALPWLLLEEYSVDAIPAPVENGSNTATIMVYFYIMQYVCILLRV